MHARNEDTTETDSCEDNHQSSRPILGPAPRHPPTIPCTRDGELGPAPPHPLATPFPPLPPSCTKHRATSYEPAEDRRCRHGREAKPVLRHCALQHPSRLNLPSVRMHFPTDLVHLPTVCFCLPIRAFVHCRRLRRLRIYF